MLCFMDRSFCNSDCVRAECYRNYSPARSEQARKWWSHDPDNAPIALADYKTGCEDYLPPKNTPTGRR